MNQDTMLHLLLVPIAALVISDSALPPTDTTRDTLPRAFLMPARSARRAIEYSDLYYTRLTIHRYGSYAMLPLFGAEYLLGQRLLDGRPDGDWVKGTHVGVATAIGGLFAVNTVTGLWNLWDARKDPNARTLRYVHAALLLAADAGFAITPLVVDDDFGSSDRRILHRNLAIGSMSIATIGTAIMWFRKD